MPTIIEFDVTLFRQQFPAFANETTYPDALLEMYWGLGTDYVSNEDSTCNSLSGNSLVYALNLMTAHLTTIAGMVVANKAPNLPQSATIGSVTVSLVPPPLASQWGWWLSTTVYGAQLLALLQLKSVGGVMIGGSLEQWAFRKTGNLF